MPLPKLLTRKSADHAAAGPDESAPAQQARTVAKRRLVGAVVLLAAGVIGFPLLFDTQPRPSAVDVPMLIAAQAPSRAAQSASKSAPAVRPPPADSGIEAAGAQSSAAQDSEAERSPGKAQAKPASAPAKPASAPVKPASAPAEPAAREPSPPAAKAADDGPKTATATRAPAASAVAAASASSASRFVVQVGAYADQAAMREVRQKVERLGLKTYTQEVETEAGKRTRLRVGPYPNRAEAEQASQRLKGVGLPANLLVL